MSLRFIHFASFSVVLVMHESFKSPCKRCSFLSDAALHNGEWKWCYIFSPSFWLHGGCKTSDWQNSLNADNFFGLFQQGQRIISPEALHAFKSIIPIFYVVSNFSIKLSFRWILGDFEAKFSGGKFYRMKKGSTVKILFFSCFLDNSWCTER